MSLARPLPLLVTLAVAILAFAAAVEDARADGAALYRERCASCHGDTGAGDTPVGRALEIRSFAGSSFSREVIQRLLSESKSHQRITAFSEAELDALMAHLATLKDTAKSGS